MESTKTTEIKTAVSGTKYNLSAVALALEQLKSK